MQNRLSDANVLAYLRERLPLPAGEARVEPAGDGNINWVRRVRAGGQSLVVKQAGPALERFPEYAVSPDRIAHEHRYYRTVAPFDRDAVCPRVLHFDPENRVLLLEDLGRAERLDAALARGQTPTTALADVAAFLGRVHAGTRGRAGLDAFPDGASDDGVLRLHLDHVFVLPFTDNDFPLPGPLRARARALARDAELGRRLVALHRACCEREGGVLVHGDVQPTNLLLADSGPKLLDAEMAHCGRPSFDLGIFFAHLVLAEVARGRPGRSAGILAPLWAAYTGEAPGAARFADVASLAGVEILRRTLGAARVPAVAEERVAEAAVALGRRLVCGRFETPRDLATLDRPAASAL